MALTAEQLAYIHSELGDTPDNSALNARMDSLHSVSAVVVEQLRVRRSSLLDGTPLSFTIPGFVTIDDRGTLEALDAQIARVIGLAEAIDAGNYDADPGLAVQLVERVGYSRSEGRRTRLGEWDRRWVL